MFDSIESALRFVHEKLVAQGRRCVTSDRGSCVYTNEAGEHCAAGFALDLTAEDARELASYGVPRLFHEVEMRKTGLGFTPDYFRRKLAVNGLTEDHELSTFWTAVQGVHDDRINWNFHFDGEVEKCSGFKYTHFLDFVSAVVKLATTGRISEELTLIEEAERRPKEWRKFLALADLIEKRGRFDMRNYGMATRGGSHCIFNPQELDECGTTACVAGWLNYMEGRPLGRVDPAAVSLGLTAETALYRLFYADKESVWAEQAHLYGWKTKTEDDTSYDVGGVSNWQDITAAQAADVLRKIAHGIVQI